MLSLVNEFKIISRVSNNIDTFYFEMGIRVLSSLRDILENNKIISEDEISKLYSLIKQLDDEQLPVLLHYLANNKEQLDEIVGSKILFMFSKIGYLISSKLATTFLDDLRRLSLGLIGGIIILKIITVPFNRIKERVEKYNGKVYTEINSTNMVFFIPYSMMQPHKTDISWKIDGNITKLYLKRTDN